MNGNKLENFNKHSFVVNDSEKEKLMRRVIPVLKDLKDSNFIKGFKGNLAIDNRDLFDGNIDLIIYTKWGKKVLCQVEKIYDSEARKKCNDMGMYYLGVEAEQNKESIKRMILNILLSNTGKQ